MSILKSLKNLAVSSEEEKANLWIEDYNANSTALTSLLSDEDSDFSFLKGYKSFDRETAWSNVESILGVEDPSLEQLDYSVLKNYKSYDKESAWSKVESAIQEEAVIRPLHHIPTVKRSVFPMIMKIAAAGAILLAAMFALKPTLTSTSSGIESMVYDAKDELNLPDGSLIYFDKGSSVEYNALNFTEDRQLAFEGRAYFDIAKSDQGKNFIIENDEFTVEILGTEFEINTIADEPTVIVTEGKVKITRGSQVEILTANQSVSLVDGELLRSEITSDNVKSWITGQLVFDSAPLSEVIHDLQRHFSIEISTSQVDLSCPWNATFDNDSLEEILEDLKQTRGGTNSIESSQVSISNIACN